MNKDIMIERCHIGQYSGTHPPEDVENIIRERLIPERWIRNSKRISYLNTPLAFDIETSSFYENGEKRAIMYGWTLNINGEVILGRTWDEFISVINAICEIMGTSSDKRIIIWCHNLAYEFQFIRKWFTFSNVFALALRKPVYARTDNGIEFRCSYVLTGYSLERLGEGLTRYPVKKVVGGLDYSKLRHNKTPLTATECLYMENDVRVVVAYIQEQIEKEGDITKIPLTKTGYVRRYCRNACLYGHVKSHKKAYQFHRYRRIISPLKLNEDEYKMLKRAFQGGFTHANAFRANKTLYNVSSLDFTSSYPAVMVAEKFPMGRGERISIKSRADLKYNIIRYCCVFDVEFEDLEADTLIEHPLSLSKCWNVENASVDNGRVVSADRLRTTITGEDFETIDRFYTFKGLKIGAFIRYPKAYLPTEFIKSILELYKDKTELKGVEGEEDRYSAAKENINACYGMTVTDIVRPDILYSADAWASSVPDLDKMLTKENESKRRFLFYPWGVWVTAYARRNLFGGIWECGTDYVYSDTDSVKTLHYEKHQRYFEEYNHRIIEKLREAMHYHKLSEEYITPKTLKGIEKPLGVWDFEGTYSRFKTLGAKRYLTEAEGHISMTVSGVNKKYAVPYLLNRYGADKIFDKFTDGLTIPAGHTGKSTHTYIDDEIVGIITDYTGTRGRYYERSAVHLEECGYDMSLSAAYIDYLRGIKEYNK